MNINYKIYQAYHSMISAALHHDRKETTKQIDKLMEHLRTYKESLNANS